MEIVVILNSNIPLAKFSVRNVSVDLIFADFVTPQKPVSVEYFNYAKNICPTNHKSHDCLNSLHTMKELQRIVNSFGTDSFEIFSRVTKVVKYFAQAKGIYSFKLGYLNGISIMIMVAYVISKEYHRLRGSVDAMTQDVVIEFFRTFGLSWDWDSNYI